MSNVIVPSMCKIQVVYIDIYNVHRFQAEHDGRRLTAEPRTIILPHRSAEELSDLIVKEGVQCVVCGGIEDSFHKFFTWKKITVIDNGVIGAHAEAMMSAPANSGPARFWPRQNRAGEPVAASQQSAAACAVPSREPASMPVMPLFARCWTHAATHQGADHRPGT